MHARPGAERAAFGTRADRTNILTKSCRKRPPQFQEYAANHIVKTSDSLQGVCCSPALAGAGQPLEIYFSTLTRVWVIRPHTLMKHVSFPVPDVGLQLSQIGPTERCCRCPCCSGGRRSGSTKVALIAICDWHLPNSINDIEIPKKRQQSYDSRYHSFHSMVTSSWS